LTFDIVTGAEPEVGQYSDELVNSRDEFHQQVKAGDFSVGLCHQHIGKHSALH